MHEMALCESMLKIIEENATNGGFTKVKTVFLEIGKLSHVDPEAITFCFGAVSRGSLCDGATLEIDRPDGQAWCLDCSQTVSIREKYDACPDCGSYKVKITDGEEMRVKELEVE